MIVGAHAILYSRDAEADRGFLRDVLGFPSVDAGDGWLIFALPPSEVAVHPSEANDRHEVFLMCDDIRDFIRSLRARKVRCSPVREADWGSVTKVTLPGGGSLGVYQPKHPRPGLSTRKRTRSARGAGRAGTRPKRRR